MAIDSSAGGRSALPDVIGRRSPRINCRLIASMSASWTSFTTVRLSARCSSSVSASESVRQRSRAQPTSSAIRSRLSTNSVPLGACILGEPEHPHRVLLAHPDERRRRRGSGGSGRRSSAARSSGGRIGAVGSTGGSPSRSEAPSGRAGRVAVPPEPAALCRAERVGERVRLLAVREVGGVDELLRRNAAEGVEEVDGAPDGGVEEDARPAREDLRERREIRDP